MINQSLLQVYKAIGNPYQHYLDYLYISHCNPFGDQGPILLTWNNSVPAGISNHMPSNVGDEIAYLFWNEITYIWWMSNYKLVSKLIYVNKKGPMAICRQHVGLHVIQ